MRNTIRFELPRFDRYKTIFVNGCVLTFALSVHLFHFMGLFAYTYTELSVCAALAILAVVNICLRLVTCEPILETPWQRTLREIGERADVYEEEDSYSERRRGCGFCDITDCGHHEQHCPHSLAETEPILLDEVMNGHVDKFGTKH